MDEQIKKPKNGQINQSVKLSAEEVEAINHIAAQWKVTPHYVRHFAIARLIADVKRGWKPKKKTKTVTTLEP